MKRTTTERGLFADESVQPESDRELEELLAEQPRNPLDVAEDFARSVISDAGIDPDALFEKIEVKNGDVICRGTRAAVMDRTDLHHTVDDAINLLSTVRQMRLYLKDYPEHRHAFYLGLDLAHQGWMLHANLHWEKPVRGYFGSRRKSEYLPLVRDMINAIRAEGEDPTGAEVARRLQLSGVSISDRQARDLLRKLLRK